MFGMEHAQQRLQQQKKTVTTDTGNFTLTAGNVANGTYQTLYEVGKLKELTLTYDTGMTETIDVEIVGIDHDNLADGTGKAGLTFIVKEMPFITSPMNSGSTSNSGGWNSTYMRSSTIQTVYNALPEELRNVIKPVIKKASAGSKSSDIVESTDSVWIPSYIEVCADASSTGSVYTNEGETYSIYASNSDRQKYKTDGVTLSTYWTRSPVANSMYGFWYVTSNGELTTFGSDSSMGVAFGFCI